MGIADDTPQKGYCIYAHVNKVNGKIYIGISKDVYKRWIGKIHAYKHSNLFQNALKKYGWDGFDHVVLWDNLSLEEACKQEKALIFLYKFIDKSYNITDGGEGHEGVHLTEVQKQRLREVHLGKVFSEEHRKKLSEAQKLSSHRRRRVYKFDSKTGEFLKEYSSLVEASSDTGIRDSLISSAARGINNTAGDFIWSYIPIIDVQRLNHKKDRVNRRKKLYCYDLKGNHIKTYDCAYDAAKDLNANCKTFSAYCTHPNRLTYKGFIWRYTLCEIEPEILNKIQSKYEAVRG